MIRIFNPASKLHCTCVDAVRALIDTATERQYDFVIVDGHPVATVHGVAKLAERGYSRESASRTDSGVRKIYHYYDCEFDKTRKLVERNGYYPEYRWLDVPIDDALAIIDPTLPASNDGGM
jgi:hypothetical protein